MPACTERACRSSCSRVIERRSDCHWHLVKWKLETAGRGKWEVGQCDHDCGRRQCWPFLPRSQDGQLDFLSPARPRPLSAFLLSFHLVIKASSCTSYCTWAPHQTRHSMVGGIFVQLHRWQPSDFRNSPVMSNETRNGRRQRCKPRAPVQPSLASQLC